MTDDAVVPGTGEKVALDEINTLNGAATSTPKPKAHRVKPGFGDDGIFRDVSTSYPLPVEQIGGGDASESTLVQIENNTDGLEAALASLLVAVDGVEGLLTADAITTAVRDRIGATTSPAAGTSNKLLTDILAALAAGGGDATETTLQAVRDRVGATTSPAAGSTNKLLTDLLAAFAAGGGDATEGTLQDILGAVAGILDVSVTDQPALASTTDTVAAKLATDVLMNNTSALIPKFAVIDDATAGDNTLVAGVTGKKIRVVSLFLVASGGENTVRFESGAGGTALTGQMQVSDNNGFVLPFSPVGWFETAVATLLNLELSAATSVDGNLVYVEV